MLRPRNDLVLVKRDKPATKSAGGIELVLAADADQEPAYGEVLAVGPKVDVVKAGDRVLIGHYGGTTVKVDGEDVVLLKEEELLGVVDG